jgi:uncharacterized protein (DUF608 family)
MESNRIEEDPICGDVTVATDASDFSFQEYWFRGSWFDNLEVFWRDLNIFGKFKNRRYNIPSPKTKEHCTLAAHLNVKPNQTGIVKFIISWSFPIGKNWKNYYASIFKNSSECAKYCLENWERLYHETMEFKNALFSSTLPTFVLDAVSANLSIIKTPTVLRLEDGSFYGFEGCTTNSGCCEGSCTHVWNYTYVLPFLFPKLERSMRDLDFKYNKRDDGRMSFRLQLPLGSSRQDFRACADGQFGGVIKSYRDWKISGDSEWLKSNWEAIKNSIEYAWARTNEDKWDLDKDGILEGRQHHTLDMELFGPNSWLTGFYLAALKAGAEMADFFGENEKADEYLGLFNRGKLWVDKHLFNGEYYHQLIDLKDKTILERFLVEDPDIVKTYWDEEHEEIKYQIVEGCEIDQVLAQWHANLCGLGEIFNKKQLKKALRSIFKYNFKRSMRGFFNPCRIFALNDEAGLVIADWPKEKYKPVIPLPYSGETMNGYEYAAAITMIQEGLIQEGLTVVKAVRNRYNGENRNPWNEFECGSNYSRSMASYALLLALSGFEYNLVDKEIGFNPIEIKEKHDRELRYFWCIGTGWGIVEIKHEKVVIKVLFGDLTVNKLKLPFLKKAKPKKVLLNEATLDFRYIKDTIRFEKNIMLSKGFKLVAIS